MAVAPGPVVSESPLASPELALVDAVLAAELRLGLCPVEDSSLPPRTSFAEAAVAIEKDTPVQSEFAEDDQPGDAQYLRESEHRVEVIERTPGQSQGTSSHYPLLPALEPEEEAIQETEAALRRIRERPTDESLARRLGT